LGLRVSAFGRDFRMTKMTARLISLSSATILLTSAAILPSAVPTQAAAQSHSEMILFDGGGTDELNGLRYHWFRIPSLVRSNANTVGLGSFRQN